MVKHTHLDDGRVLLFLEKQFHVGVGHVEDDGLALGPRRQSRLDVHFLVRFIPEPKQR